MTRRYRFACMVVEGQGAKMRTVEVGSKQTAHSAEVLIEHHRIENNLSRKRVGVFDRKLSRWVSMPSVLH